MDAPRRRLRTVAELVAHTAVVTRPEQACERALETLARESSDLEWAGIYLAGADGRPYHAGGTDAMPEADWPFAELLDAVNPVWLEDRSAVLLPLRAARDGPALGVLVVGLDAGGAPDEELLGFLAQVGQTIAAAITIAALRSRAEKQVQTAALQEHALQTFFVIGLLARAALADLAPDRLGDNVASALVRIIDTATTGREHQRKALLASGQAEIGRSGVIEDLRSLAFNFRQRTGIDAEVIVTGSVARSLSAETVDTLYQTALEAFANIERHAHAGAVMISVRMTRTSVTLSIHDDGVGVANPTPKRIASGATDFGLRGVGLRVRRLGGTFVARAAREGGFVVRTRIPLSKD